MSLFTFTEIQQDDAELILTWRRNPRVDKFMKTEVPDDLVKQRTWIQSCYQWPGYYHWKVHYQGRPIGLINVADFDFARRRTSWGFYIGENSLVGLGGFVPPYLYNYIFLQLGMKEINAEVFSSSISLLKLHEIHGYTRVPSGDRDIKKGIETVRLLAIRLCLETWQKQTRFHRLVSPFPISQWLARPLELPINPIHNVA